VPTSNRRTEPPLQNPPRFRPNPVFTDTLFVTAHSEAVLAIGADFLG
jgi:hypothetical protein